MSEETPETEAADQPLLLNFPEFEGQVPVGVVTRLNGTGQRITRPLGLEDRVILVIEAEVSNVGHKSTKDGIKREHTLKVVDLFEAEGREGKKLLSNMRVRAKKAEDERRGQTSLNVDKVHTDHGQTLDENGTALTPDEVAAARGDQVEEKTEDLSDGEEPVILIFSDESRALWPDDYVGGDWTTPYAGDFIVNPNLTDRKDELRVVKVLDAGDGELIEEWDGVEQASIDEEERLKAEEAKAEKPKPKAKPKKKAAAKKKPEIDKVEQSGVGEAEEPALPGDEA